MAWPSNSLDNWRDLQPLLGTFWSLCYDNQRALGALLAARQLAGDQGTYLWRYLYDCLDRHRTPTYKHSPRVPIDLSGTSPSLYPATTALRRVPLLLDAALSPSSILVDGIDYTFADGSFTFSTTPATRTDPYWAWHAESEAYYQRDYVGSVTGLSLASSPAYGSLLNALYDAAVSTPSLANLCQVVTALTGLPFGKEGEVVEAITTDADGKLVLTSESVYRLKSTTPVSVAVGDVLTAGQSITSAAQILIPPCDLPVSLTQVVLDSGMVDPSLNGSLTFTNTDEPLTVTSNVSGFTKVAWSMPDDVTRVANFFSAIHTRGVAASQTLAMYLDVRGPVPPTQPTAASLPATINPLDLLVNTILRNGTILVLVGASEVTDDGLGLEHAPWAFRQVSQPGTRVLLVEI